MSETLSIEQVRDAIATLSGFTMKHFPAEGHRPAINNWFNKKGQLIGCGRPVIEEETLDEITGLMPHGWHVTIVQSHRWEAHAKNVGEPDAPLVYVSSPTELGARTRLLLAVLQGASR